MAEILVITEHATDRPYKRIFTEVGHNVHFLARENLNELLELAQRDYFRLDALVLSMRAQGIEETVSRVRKSAALSDTPIIVVGSSVDADFAMRHKLFLMPTLKGTFLVTILEQRLQLEGNAKSTDSKVGRIIRSIEFPPEYHRSGITILSYFADVLRHKKLSEDVKVSIEQSGLNVSLVIESSSGQRELVERTLEAYALVVTKRQPIETLTTDPYEIAELKSQLRIADAQIESQRDLMAVKNAEVTNLRAEVEETKGLVRRMEQRADEDRERFLSLIEGLVSHNTDISAKLMELQQQASQAQNTALSGALENLYKVINRGVREEDREAVINNLGTIQREDPGVFKRLYDVLVAGAISGAAGNYLYSWLQFFVGSLPK